MSKHAPEPWKCEGHVVYFPNAAGGFSLRDCPGAVATARRIVACVNACSGIRTEALECRAHMLKAHDDTIAELTRQHDELVAENERLRTALECATNHSPDAWKMVPDGWQLVPVEPTIEMVQAATHSTVGFGTRAAYRAMLAAAPKLGGE